MGEVSRQVSSSAQLLLKWRKKKKKRCCYYTFEPEPGGNGRDRVAGGVTHHPTLLSQN